MMEGAMGNTELLNEWRGRIEDYRTSGLTMIQWCEKTGYSMGQLKYWIAKCNALARKAEVGGFARVEIVDSSSTAKIAVHVGVARIEVERGFDRVLLSEVMRVAASIC
jgi:hypothetical protein